MTLVTPFRDRKGTEWHVELGRHDSPANLKVDNLDALVLEGGAGNVKHPDVQYKPLLQEAKKKGIPVYATEQRYGLQILQHGIAWATMGMLSGIVATAPFKKRMQPNQISRREFLKKITAYGSLATIAGYAPAYLSVLSVPKANNATKQEVMTTPRKVIGQAAVDPIVGLRSAIIAHKVHFIAEHLRKKGVERPRIGVVVGAGHYYILEHLARAGHKPNVLSAYGPLVKAETDINLVHEFRHDGKKWVRRDLRLE